MVQLTGSLISLFGARAFSGWAAGQVFERFLAGSFRDQIAANIAAGGAVSLDGIAQRYAGFLPEAFRASIVDACERSISAVLNDNAVVLADTIVQKVLAPLLTPVISLVLFFVAFALLRMLVSLLVTVLGLVNKLPVIGAVNHWLGWGVGGIASLVDIYLENQKLTHVKHEFDPIFDENSEILSLGTLPSVQWEIRYSGAISPSAERRWG